MFAISVPLTGTWSKSKHSVIGPSVPEESDGGLWAVEELGDSDLVVLGRRFRGLQPHTEEDNVVWGQERVRLTHTDDTTHRVWLKRRRGRHRSDTLENLIATTATGFITAPGSDSSGEKNIEKQDRIINQKVINQWQRLNADRWANDKVTRYKCENRLKVLRVKKKQKKRVSLNSTQCCRLAYL